MEPLPTPQPNSRLGFHYYPDALHYRESDLTAWLPELKALKASWLTLVAPPDRAIPESFLRSLLDAGIEPILHFHMPIDPPVSVRDLRMLLQNYANWGVHYIVLFDRPNLRSSWPAVRWSQSNLVERFLDIYLPLTEAVVDAGLIPVFPPLEPGGDYWDTAFLRGALRGMNRRGYLNLLSKLVIGCYAFSGNRYLNWGAGGPERWPSSRPYLTPPGSEDQCGFRIFDWYLAISNAILGEASRVMIIAGGSQVGDRQDAQFPPIDPSAHARRNIALAALMMNLDFDASLIRTNYPNDQGLLDQVPAEVLCCNYWLLCAEQGSPEAAQAWYRPNGDTLPVAEAMKSWMRNVDAALPTNRKGKNAFDFPAFIASIPHAHGGTAGSLSGDEKTYSHYLLLPVQGAGSGELHLDTLRPFIQKYRPTVGFSPAEAARSWKVTLVGDMQAYPEDTIEGLRKAGCVIDVMAVDGMSIASEIAVR
jgi:hypothetical protein